MIIDLLGLLFRKVQIFIVDVTTERLDLYSNVLIKYLVISSP